MHKLRFTIQSDVTELKTATRKVVGFLTAHNVPDTPAYFARMVAEELTVNVVRHAFDDEGTHEIGVELEIDDTHVIVSVEDDGREFDPTGAPDPDLQGSIEQRDAGGLGVYLVRKVTENMTYERTGGQNRVTAAIRLDGRIK